MAEVYQVKLEKFEGPLDLLLQLIEKEKLDITEVSLAKICDQYVKYLKQVQEVDPGSLADFLVIAARLLLIKSRALLPEIEMSEEEELSIEELQERLREYKRFKDVAKKLKVLYFSSNTSFEQRFFLEEKRAFFPSENLTLENLLIAYKALLQILEREKKLATEYIPETISIEEKIAQLEDLILKKVNPRFQELLKHSQTKLESIVTFLALLELVKQRIVKVRQKKLFEDIVLERNKIANYD